MGRLLLNAEHFAPINTTKIFYGTAIDTKPYDKKKGKQLDSMKKKRCEKLAGRQTKRSPMTTG